MFVLNANRYARLNERMQDEFLGNIDLGGSKVKLTLTNDEATPVTYWVDGVFHNGDPVHFRRQFSLERRKSSDIVLSNVGAAWLEESTSAVAVMLDI